MNIPVFLQAEDNIAELASRYELDDVRYVSMPGPSSESVFVSTLSQEWNAFYRKNNFHLIDPTIYAPLEGILPVDWSVLEGDPNFQAIYTRSETFGLTPQGFSFPIRGPYGDVGLLSVFKKGGSSSWGELKSRVLGELQLHAAQLHELFSPSARKEFIRNELNLTLREIEILQWTVVGKSQQDIGDILKLSARTVENHLRRARQKLEAKTTPQAVGRAIGLKLIFPEI